MHRSFALVHSPLVGAATWQGVAERLRTMGERAIVPDLTPALRGGPPYVELQVAAVKRSVGDDPVVLVGHSGAGPLLPAFGEHLDVAGYVFVDAGLPAPGQSWMDTAPPKLADQLEAMAKVGWLPPWSRWWGEDGLAELLPDERLRRQFTKDCPPLPLAMFRESRPQVEGWPDAGCGYLTLSDNYTPELEQARTLGWATAELPSHHLAMLTDPDAVAQAILDLTKRLG